MKNLDSLDKALDKSIDLLKESEFYQQLSTGKNAKQLYTKYLEYAYHYVCQSSSFTPLAARRMDIEYISTRKWILEHSAETLSLKHN